MSEPFWQKSTYSQEASACIYIAARHEGAHEGTILLRESDEPEAILTTGTPQLAALISTLRTEDRT